MLAGDDARAYGRYKALGDPKAIETALQERDHYKEIADTAAREKLHAEVAAAVGYRPGVLSRLATTDGLDLVVQDVLGADKKPVLNRAGKPTRAAFVKGADEKLTPLADYAAKNWAEFLPAPGPLMPRQGRPARRRNESRDRPGPGSPSRTAPHACGAMCSDLT